MVPVQRYAERVEQMHMACEQVLAFRVNVRTGLHDVRTAVWNRRRRWSLRLSTALTAPSLYWGWLDTGALY